MCSCHNEPGTPVPAASIKKNYISERLLRKLTLTTLLGENYVPKKERRKKKLVALYNGHGKNSHFAH
jgi:hypothetical protein